MWEDNIPVEVAISIVNWIKNRVGTSCSKTILEKKGDLMGTTRERIREWIERGQEEGATHVIVVCDTFDWEDYPVMVKPGEDVRKK